MSDIDAVRNALQQAINDGDSEKANQYADLLERMQSFGPAPLEDRGLGEAVRHGLQQGATFGFADEASAAARALLDPLMDRLTGVPEEFRNGDQSFMERYQMYRDDERQQIAAGREHHGGAMLAAEFVPGVLQAGAGLLGRGAQVGGRAALDQLAQRTLGQNIRQGARAGAGYGALAGAGYGEGETMGERAMDIGLGAGMGAGMGAGFPILGSGIKRTYQGIASRLGSDRQTEAARRRAHTDLMIAMEQDRVDPQQIARRLAQDDSMMVLDAGPNIQALGKQIVRMPGEGGAQLKQIVRQRQRQAQQRVQPELRRFMTEAGEDVSRPDNFARAERSIMDRARQQADDEGLWDMAYRDDYNAPRSMLNFLKRNDKGQIIDPDARGAYNIAIKNLKKRVNSGEITMAQATQPARVHDAVLRALKSRIRLQRNPMSRYARTTEETTLANNQYRKLLKDYADEAPDEWVRARELWGGEAANLEAFEAGKRVLSGHVDDISYGLERMSQSERDHYLVGALRTIEQTLKRKGDTTDIMRQLRDTEAGRELMRALAGSEKNFRQFLRVAEREVDFLDTFRNLTRGSDTFENLATGQAQALGGEVGTVAGIVAQQSGIFGRLAGIPMLGRGLGRRLAGGIARRDEARRNQLAEFLKSRDPEQFLAMMERPAMPSATPSAITGVAGATQLPGLLED